MHMLRIKVVVIVSPFGRARPLNGFSLAICRVPCVCRVAQHAPYDMALPSSNIAACGDTILIEFACDGVDAQMLIDKQVKDLLDDFSFTLVDFIASVFALCCGEINVTIG